MRQDQTLDNFDAPEISGGVEHRPFSSPAIQTAAIQLIIVAPSKSKSTYSAVHFYEVLVRCVCFFFPSLKMFLSRAIAACGAARDKCLKSCQLPLQQILFSNQAGLLQWNRANHRAFSGTSLSAPHPYLVALSHILFLTLRMTTPMHADKYPHVFKDLPSLINIQLVIHPTSSNTKRRQK